ncbi:PaaX family transcriptional regulator C-terminal domain-containing protein [Actinocorallia sp. A-T 12471]|uniref:PaaX family transcriptional regulator n=1 Tax=Actinocorallia sp. A-T 12471 TaxID=3089813 RepID=UPI0029D2DE3D|nr:PaaX family transcriptional regulator C-terminal domain-containing protein [Actinocorallia sp. A-T 12471]MDX6742413.1 PaaX family transcriptional regulator C-terminal domain-containing protein [Actinocorallia sp. A-T 12471]
MAVDDTSIDGTWTGATPSMADTPRAGTADTGPPRMLIMDVCGAYMRPLGGWFAIAKIVQLMQELGVDEAATRSALQRMRRKDLLVPERRNGVRGLRLTDHALMSLDASDQRIFGPRSPARLHDGWVLVSFSIPEEERSRRHVLRSRLSWLGFGNLSNGLWMAPRRMMGELEKAVRELGYQRYVLLFEAHYAGFEELSSLVGQAWDLRELGTLYADFVAWCEPVAARWRAARPTGAQAFADYTLCLYHWRKFPYLDPGLPPELLPRDWAGRRAADLFFDLRTSLEDAALDHVRRTCALG